MIDAGLDMRTVIKVEIEASPEIILETMIRPVMKKQFPGKKWKNPDKPSTTELDTFEYKDLYETMNRATGQSLGISIDWPSEERQFYKAMGYVK